MIGINTIKATGGESIGFAIAVTAVLPLVHELTANDRIARRYSGASVANVTEASTSHPNLAAKKGVIALQLEAGSPAQKASLQREDIIVSLADKPIAKLSDLHNILLENRAERTVDLQYYRGASNGPETSLWVRGHGSTSYPKHGVRKVWSAG